MCPTVNHARRERPTTRPNLQPGRLHHDRESDGGVTVLNSMFPSEAEYNCRLLGSETANGLPVITGVWTW